MARKKSKGVARIDRVGLFSRIDYGSSGFRRGLLKALFSYFSEVGVNIAVLVGGLVSRRDFQVELARKVTNARTSERDRMAREKSSLPRNERTKAITLATLGARCREQLIDAWARDLATIIPAIEHHGKQIKIYIITSPASAYDGDVGWEIAMRLHELRVDIVCWDQTDGRFPIKFGGVAEDFDFRAITPPQGKNPWRSDYYSTSPIRLVRDKQRQSSQGAPGLWVVGCGGVAFHIPKGEYPTPIIALPALHRIQAVQSAENQIGGCVVEFSKEKVEPRVITYSLKDLTSFERYSIPEATNANQKQNAILRQFSTGPKTIGMLDDALSSKRSTIEREIQDYQKKNLQPALIKLPSEKYDVDPGFFQNTLQYTILPKEQLTKDSFIAFGCLHAGYPRVQYDWFINELPRQMLEQGIMRLVGAGDYVAGTKHNLIARGEVYRGLNNTKQEKLAAEMIQAVLMKVFSARFVECMQGTQLKSGPKLAEAVGKSLPEFLYWQGNHDKWALDENRDPLDTFNTHLVAQLRREIRATLTQHGFDPLHLPDIESIIMRKIVFAPKHILPSSLTLSIAHPEMGRMLTASGRAQQTMAFCDDAHIVILANFHVGIVVHEWSDSLGQRVAVQVPTLTSGTAFEDGKNKRCDVGVYTANIWSQNQRIILTDTYFAGPSRISMTALSNDDDYKVLLDRMAERSS